MVFICFIYQNFTLEIDWHLGINGRHSCLIIYLCSKWAYVSQSCWASSFAPHYCIRLVLLLFGLVLSRRNWAKLCIASLRDLTQAKGFDRAAIRIIWRNRHKTKVQTQHEHEVQATASTKEFSFDFGVKHGSPGPTGITAGRLTCCISCHVP